MARLIPAAAGRSGDGREVPVERLDLAPIRGTISIVI